MTRETPRRFIDSNVFVYVLSADPRYAPRALRVLEAAERLEYQAYTSTLVVSQVLAHLERRRRPEAARLFLEYLEEQPIRVAETTLGDFVEARRAAEVAGLDFHRMWDDLVIVVQMRRLGITEIYSNDADFDKIPGVRRLF